MKGSVAGRSDRAGVSRVFGKEKEARKRRKRD